MKRAVAALFATACAAPAPRSAAPTSAPFSEPPLASVTVESWPPASSGLGARRENLSERLFGVDVADPYRWLEDAHDAEVERFIVAQNARTEAFLRRIPGREALRARMAELLAIGSLSLPTLRRESHGKTRFFYTRREGGDEQPILYVRDGVDGAERVLVDPTRAHAGGIGTTIDWYEPSNDGALLAYGLSQSGTEDSVLYVRRVDAGDDLPDVIDRTRFGSIAWRPDAKGFFYSRYPAKGTVPAGEERLHRRIYEHRLGEPPDRDRLVFGAKAAATDFPGCAISPKGNWLVVSVGRGWNEAALYLANAHDPELHFTQITPTGDNRFSAIPREDRLFVLSNEGAPRNQVFSVDPRDPRREKWRLLVPEHETDVIQNLEVVGGELLVTYAHAGAARLARFTVAGRHVGDLPLPGLGASDGFSGLPDGDEAYYAFESFAQPREIRRLELKSGRDSRFLGVHSDIRSDDYAVDQFEARSRDGTKIPYQLVRKRTLVLGAGEAKTLLYGYGGFSQSLEPRFSRPLQAWLERGGVYVQALLRGGGEFGEAWHRAGQLTKKQNTFDDFAAVAEDLIRRGVTRPQNLAVYGRSNGGLLVAATITQRPELFRAAVAGVPLTDMLRYPRFLIGKLWVPEYGSPDDEAQFRALLAYSPYHRVRSGVAYPALLVTTADSDTRVDPLHARKFAAALQHASGSGAPILLRTERSAGHGAGTPLSKQVAELSDIYAFLFAELGLQIEPRTR